MTQKTLYLYQCRTCKITLLANTRAPQDQPYHCYCATPMSFIHARVAATAKDRELWMKARVWNGIAAPPQERRIACDTCHQLCDPTTRIDTPGAGKYCSIACAEKGAAYLEEVERRLKELYEEKPWLKPA